MTQNVSGFLPDMLGPVELQANGTAVTPRGALNFKGAKLTSRADTDAIDIDLTGDTLPTVATTDDTPVYVVLATLAVGDVVQVDVIAKVAKANGAVRQCFKLSALAYGAEGPSAVLDGDVGSTATGTGAAAVTLDVSGATVRLKVTGIAATDLVTTYEPHVL